MFVCVGMGVGGLLSEAQQFRRAVFSLCRQPPAIPSLFLSLSHTLLTFRLLFWFYRVPALRVHVVWTMVPHR